MQKNTWKTTTAVQVKSAVRTLTFIETNKLHYAFTDQLNFPAQDRAAFFDRISLLSWIRSSEWKSRMSKR